MNPSTKVKIFLLDRKFCLIQDKVKFFIDILRTILFIIEGSIDQHNEVD